MCIRDRGGILSSVFLRFIWIVYNNAVEGTGTTNEFYGCLLYAGDILLISHTVHAMQLMLHLHDKFADDFGIKFNNGKSVVMNTGKKYNEKCVSLQPDSKDSLLTTWTTKGKN